MIRVVKKVLVVSIVAAILAGACSSRQPSFDDGGECQAAHETYVAVVDRNLDDAYWSSLTKEQKRAAEAEAADALDAQNRACKTGPYQG